MESRVSPLLRPYLSLFICIPADDGMDPDDLRAMVHDVNMGVVAPEEKLSDEIMLYDGARLSIVGDSLKMEPPGMDIPKIESHTMRMAM